MQCPVCQVALQMTERQGVEIDYCPQCRGVWLDRGELDKILERSVSQGGQAQPARPPAPGYSQAGYPPRRDHDDWDDDHPKHRRRKNWLEELFD